MNTKNIFSKVCLALVLAGLSVVCFAQESSGTKKNNADLELLQGEWVLENSNWFYESNITSIDVEKPPHEIYMEIVFKNDSIFAKSEKQNLSGQYQINVIDQSYMTQNGAETGSTYQISFSFMLVPFGACSIIDDKLCVIQQIENTQNESMYLSLTYKRK